LLLVQQVCEHDDLDPLVSEEVRENIVLPLELLPVIIYNDGIRRIKYIYAE
jgi:hypothetical protein